MAPEKITNAQELISTLELLDQYKGGWIPPGTDMQKVQISLISASLSLHDFLKELESNPKFAAEFAAGGFKVEIKHLNLKVTNKEGEVIKPTLSITIPYTYLLDATTTSCTFWDQSPEERLKRCDAALYFADMMPQMQDYQKIASLMYVASHLDSGAKLDSLPEKFQPHIKPASAQKPTKSEVVLNLLSNTPEKFLEFFIALKAGREIKDIDDTYEKHITAHAVEHLLNIGKIRAAYLLADQIFDFSEKSSGLTRAFLVPPFIQIMKPKVIEELFFKGFLKQKDAPENTKLFWRDAIEIISKKDTSIKLAIYFTLPEDNRNIDTIEEILKNKNFAALDLTTPENSERILKAALCNPEFLPALESVMTRETLINKLEKLTGELIPFIKNLETDTLKALLDSKPELNKDYRYALLMLAIEKQEAELAAKLINAGADLNLKNEWGSTVLMIAIGKRYTDLANKMIDAGADIHKQDLWGDTALMIAIEEGCTDLANKLLDTGANINLQKQNGKTALIIALENGYLDLANRLTDAGADIHKKNRYEETTLMIAIEKGYTDLANKLLDLGVDPNKLGCGRSALMIALDKGYTDLANKLIDLGADPNNPYPQHRSPLAIAIEKGYADLANRLIVLKADINKQDEYGKTALMIAIEKGYTDLANKLLDTGANINLQKESGETALMIALENGYLDLANKLLDLKADVNLQSKNRKTALIIAVVQQNIAIVNKLLDLGADPNKQNYFGDTALMIADQKGNAEMVSKLLASNKQDGAELIRVIKRNYIDLANKLIGLGADINKQDEYGKTALMIAIEKGCTDLVNKLIDLGADINKQDERGETALILAIQKGYTDLASRLVDAGADLDLQNKFEETALIYTAIKSNADIARKLLTLGVDPNLPNDLGNTALMFAANRGNADVINELLASKADPNLQNKNGHTALMKAARRGNIAIVNKLIDAGANPNLQDDDGENALIIAIKAGHIDVVNKLIDAGANLNLENKSGKTALIIALQTKWTENIMHLRQKLIDAGALVNIKYIKEDSELISAVERGEINLARAALDLRDEISLTDRFNLIYNTLSKGKLHLAWTISKLLFKRGAPTLTATSKEDVEITDDTEHVSTAPVVEPVAQSEHTDTASAEIGTVTSALILSSAVYHASGMSFGTQPMLEAGYASSGAGPSGAVSSSSLVLTAAQLTVQASNSDMSNVDLVKAIIRSLPQDVQNKLSPVGNFFDSFGGFFQKLSNIIFRQTEQGNLADQVPRDLSKMPLDWKKKVFPFIHPDTYERNLDKLDPDTQEFLTKADPAKVFSDVYQAMKPDDKQDPIIAGRVYKWEAKLNQGAKWASVARAGADLIEVYNSGGTEESFKNAAISGLYAYSKYTGLHKYSMLGTVLSTAHLASESPESACWNIAKMTGIFVAEYAVPQISMPLIALSAAQDLGHVLAYTYNHLPSYETLAGLVTYENEIQ